MTTSTMIHWADGAKTYQFVVVASGPTTAQIDERSWPIGGGSMSEVTYNLTDVAVVGNKLMAKAAAPMWQTANVELELVVPSSFHLMVTGLRFGLGNVDEEGTLSAADFASLQDLMKTGGWPTS